MAGGAADAGAPVVLVVNQWDANLSVVDVAAQKEVATISEGVTEVHGHEVAASPDGKTAYVPIYGSSGVGKPGIDGHQMLVMDIASRKITGQLDFGKGVRPHCVVYDPVSKLLYVTTELEKSVTIVDPKTLKIVGEIPTEAEESHMLAISPDGKRGYTSNVGPGTVSVLDLKARKAIVVIPVTPGAQRIAVSRDGSMAFTADQSQPRLAVIDTKTNTLKRWVTIPSIAYGTGATLDGKWLVVTMKRGVAALDLNTMEVTRVMEVPGAPQEVLIAPDGKTAYVSSMVANERGVVAAIDLAEWKVASLINVGKGADGLAWAGGTN
jgi:DNA-binding beta-propeller fold protein YncE